MAETPNRAVAPGVVQNLNLASDLYGDRSNVRQPYDVGVQIFTAMGDVFTPLRTENQHMLAGESETRPLVGCNFTTTFNWSSLLPKGFVSDSFYYAVTGLILAPVNFGKVTAAPVGVNTVMTNSRVDSDGAALGGDKGIGFVMQPGQVIANMFRATFAGAWAEYQQDGRKCSFVFDSLLSIPGGTGLSDASSPGLPVVGNVALLPVPFLLSPRNTNQSQETIKVHFADLNPVTDLTGVAAAGQYALAYKLSLQGYFCDAQGNPADQAFTLRSAMNAASYQLPQG